MPERHFLYAVIRHIVQVRNDIHVSKFVVSVRGSAQDVADAGAMVRGVVVGRSKIAHFLLHRKKGGGQVHHALLKVLGGVMDAGS